MAIARAVGLCVLVAPLGCGYDTAELVRAGSAPASRDKLLWPFAADSIWNTPIGSQARLIPAGIRPVMNFWPSHVYVVSTKAADPERPLLAPERPGDPCSGTRMLGTVRFPDDFVLSDDQNQNPGNSTSVLMPDGRTLVELSGLARCQAGGPVHGFAYGMEDIYGAGIRGGQGGSGLSAIGGALRTGELFGAAPIRHALKLSLFAALYYFDDPNDETRCRRWPATRCDNSHAESYRGSNPSFVMGSLLALPKSATEAGLGLESMPGRQIFAALRDYGAYIVGNAARDVVQLGIESAALQEMNGRLTPVLRDAFERDLNRILPALHIVDNNGPSSIGGGGVPLAPTAPPIGD